MEIARPSSGWKMLTNLVLKKLTELRTNLKNVFFASRVCAREKDRERYRKTEREGDKRKSDRKRKIEGMEDRKRETDGEDRAEEVSK